MIQPRQYQADSIARIQAELENHQSTLMVAATGTGKTITFAHVIQQTAGRCVVMAQREELVFQAANKIKQVTGEAPAIEMAELSANEDCIFDKARVIVTTVQTMSRPNRLARFAPADFSLLVLDECFPAGTLVDGRPIESIRIGDMVSSFSHITGTVEARPVTAVFLSITRSLVRVHMANGSTITSTPSHPFWSVSREKYVSASALNSTDVLRTCPTGFEKVSHVERLSWIDDTKVFNLEVEGNNNYFVHNNDFTNGVLVHNCHHATSSTHRRVIDHFASNASCKRLGVTATPDRYDEAALGEIFDSVACVYDIQDAISDGWLVPIEQLMVRIEDLDFSSCRTTAGDLNAGDVERAMLPGMGGSDLAAVAKEERILHGIVGPTLDLAGDMPTLVFAASVAHAERIAEIINRHHAGSAVSLHGNTPKDERRQHLRHFKEGRFQFLVNCALFLEGFDEPRIACIANASPTKSRSKYSQVIGRGTRPTPGCVDVPGQDATARKEAIACSSKPALRVLDFVGNSGRHKLVTSADILGGKYSDEVVDKAKARIAAASAKGEAADPIQELAKAEQDVVEEQRQRRQHVRARTKFSTQTVDPFDLLDVVTRREPGWHKGRMPTPKQVDTLTKAGIDISGISFWDASQLIGQIINRRERNLCTFKQAKLLSKHGYSPDLPFAEARQIIDILAANGWQKQR